MLWWTLKSGCILADEVGLKAYGFGEGLGKLGWFGLIGMYKDDSEIPCTLLCIFDFGLL